MARTGRRPGESGTRDAILTAARRRFAEHGFRGATIRGIAADAEVDPALVHHYFRTKRDLFASALELPVDPDVIRTVVASAGTDDLGERIVRTFLSVWDPPPARDRIRMVLRTAVSDERTARMIREFVVDALLDPLIRRLGRRNAQLRATLVASQMVGFALLRYVLEIEPLASLSQERVVAAYAPTIQRYLTGDL